MDGTTTVTPLDNSQQIKHRIAQLQECLEVNAPTYQSLLHTIHQNLMKDPDVVHLLSEEEIGVIVSGLSKHKNIVIATTVSKSKTSKALKNVGLDDL